MDFKIFPFKDLALTIFSLKLKADNMPIIGIENKFKMGMFCLWKTTKNK